MLSIIQNETDVNDEYLLHHFTRSLPYPWPHCPIAIYRKEHSELSLAEFAIRDDYFLHDTTQF